MSKRILVVEDQEDDRQIIRDMLGGTGYAITEAEDGEQALAAVAKERPDLILMEIQLPSMDGYEAMRRIRTDPALLSIPIIAVTSFAPSGEEQKARAAGCDDFVPKPYSPRQLLAKIRQYISGRASQEVFVELAVSGLASMYPASDWSSSCSEPSWISARMRSHYRTGLDWAVWVTSARMRREDRTSISFHPLADLGR